MTQNDLQQYLGRVLALDPVQAADQVLALRRQWLRRDEPQPQDRAQLERAIDHFAQRLLEAEPAKLDAKLAALPLADFPDLERRRDRMRQVLTARDELDRARRDTQLSAKFMRSFLEVLEAEPRRVAELRRRTLMELGSHRARGSMARTVKRIEAQYPGLHSLEQPWLEQLSRAKQEVSDRRKPASWGFGFLIAWVLFRLVLAWMRN